jgi:PAS domain S-box-containing protein
VSSHSDPWFSSLLLRSHHRFVGKPLTASRWTSDEEAARWLYEQAPFGLLAHDATDDPRFIYANRTAQEPFEYDWDEFVGLPSRLSARQDRQEDRDALLRAVAEEHHATGYRGKRVSKSGRSFWIEDVTMWELIDDDGVRHGQAAVFRSWADA